MLIVGDDIVIHGLSLNLMTVDEDVNLRPPLKTEPGVRVALRLEPFQNQKFICLGGQWVTRAEIIKYVANVGHGTHSGTAKDPTELLIRKMRRVLTIEMQTAPDGSRGPMVLLDFAQHLTSSPEVINLEELIRASG